MTTSHDADTCDLRAQLIGCYCSPTKFKNNLRPATCGKHKMGQPITGLSGRVYKDGVRLTQVVNHEENRTRDQVIAARAANQPRQPTGIPVSPVNPFEGAFARKVARLGHNWEQSPAGREARAKLKKSSKDWEQQQQDAKDRAAYQDSIADLTEFAERDYQAVLADPSTTVLDTENAAARLAAAKRGDREEYKSMHSAWRDIVLQRVAERAAVVENDRQTLAQTRDAILAEQLDAPAAEVPKIRTPDPSPIIDRSRVALTRRVQVGNSVREVVEYVAADDPRLQ
jgi:hypothetical protein